MRNRTDAIRATFFLGFVTFASAAIVSIPMLNSASVAPPHPRPVPTAVAIVGGNPFAVDPIALADPQRGGPTQSTFGNMPLPTLGNLRLPQVPGLGNVGSSFDHLPHVTALALAAEPFATVVIDDVPNPIGIGDHVLKDVVVGIDAAGVHLSNGKTLPLEHPSKNATSVTTNGPASSSASASQPATSPSPGAASMLAPAPVPVDGRLQSNADRVQTTPPSSPVPWIGSPAPRGTP